eukprot:CAMPEP_0204853952 /NCGR_PEP_ID=MMETSP1347-20130617/14330_1 /ASSEMBLY_ACC=CAM_ASM_000690 /TAXON_ID=215587 /ORGANISM="Aplanochytrium stocchinoi, Strain GSBS06" /LENGTH=178 /DNA_ID=CAMNT_0051999229 /DNA_START=89 /DNA_END=625 /DNA_ORIENTATION=-
MNAMTSPTHDACMFTIWMNDSYKELADNMFQTWNPIVDIKDELVHKYIHFERPLVTKKSVKAVADMKKINGNGSVWYCSAWNAHRIPLQESGVTSALDIYRGITNEDPQGNFIDGHNHFNVIKMKTKVEKTEPGAASPTASIIRDDELSSTSSTIKALASFTVSLAVISYVLRLTKVI